jgi:hypothetical protein
MIQSKRTVLEPERPVMLRRLSIVLLAVCVGLASLAPAAAEPVFPLGSRVGLEPPGELKPSGKFPGFEDSARKASITILDLPRRAYEEIERSIFAENQRGLAEVKRESFPFANGVGFLLTGLATENGVAIRRWFLLASALDADLTTLINVAVPESAKADYPDAAIRKALATVSFRPIPIEEQLGVMPFKLNELAGFRVLRVLPEGAVILTDGASDNLDRQPSMIISVGPGGPSEPAVRDTFARDLLATTPLHDFAMQSSEPMRIGGLPGNEIRALARGLDGSPLALVQWVRFGSGGFLRVVAFSRSEDWNTQFPRFRAVRDGIAMR